MVKAIQPPLHWFCTTQAGSLEAMESPSRPGVAPGLQAHSSAPPRKLLEGFGSLSYWPAPQLCQACRSTLVPSSEGMLLVCQGPLNSGDSDAITERDPGVCRPRHSLVPEDLASTPEARRYSHASTHPFILSMFLSYSVSLDFLSLVHSLSCGSLQRHRYRYRLPVYSLI
jgi:hypothetical protein